MQGITSQAAAAKAAAANGFAPGDAAANGTALNGAAAAAAEASHGTPLLVLYGSNTGGTNTSVENTNQFSQTSFIEKLTEKYKHIIQVISWYKHAPLHLFKQLFRGVFVTAGTCEELAGTVAGQAAAAGFSVRVASLDSVLNNPAGTAGGVLPETGAVMIVTSTYNGTPPDNAAEFKKWLEKQTAGEL